MGAWGYGIFENDTALDWINELQHFSDLSFISSTIFQILNQRDDYLDSDFACEALAAIEVVARLKGHWDEKSSPSEQVDDWVIKNRITIPQSLAVKSGQAIDMILGENSELNSLWKDSNQYNQWKSIVIDLKSRALSEEKPNGNVTSRKAQKRFVTGYFVRLPLSDGSFGYGRLCEDSYAAFYDFRTNEPISDLDEISSKPILFIVGVYKSILKTWEVIGKRPLEERLQQPIVQFHQDIGNFQNCTIFDNKGNERSATPNDCIGLERWAVWSAENVEERLLDTFFGRPSKIMERMKVRLE